MGRYRIVEVLKDGERVRYAVEKLYDYKWEEIRIWGTFYTLEQAENFLKLRTQPAPVYTKKVVKEYYG